MTTIGRIIAVIEQPRQRAPIYNDFTTIFAWRPRCSITIAYINSLFFVFKLLQTCYDWCVLDMLESLGQKTKNKKTNSIQKSTHYQPLLFFFLSKDGHDEKNAFVVILLTVLSVFNRKSLWLFLGVLLFHTYCSDVHINTHIYTQIRMASQQSGSSPAKDERYLDLFE